MKERTLILIKPDAISKRLTGIIIDRIEHLGLDMKAAKVVIMTEELARKHYPHLEGKPFLQDVINFMRGDYNGIKDHRIYAFVYDYSWQLGAYSTAGEELNKISLSSISSQYTMRAGFSSYSTTQTQDMILSTIPRPIFLWS